MDDSRLHDLYGEVLDWRHQAVPPVSHGRTLRSWLASEPAVDDLDTPVMTLSAPALEHNLAAMAAWCAERGLASDPRIVAVRVPGLDKPAGAARRARLAVGPDEPVRYRRVRLACGDHVLSEADNWYVPARLTSEMNAALDGTQAPFGRVVRPLQPSRRNLSLTRLWQPENGAMPGPAEPLFSVEAVLSAGGVPFCEVAETYTGAVLIRGEH